MLCVLNTFSLNIYVCLRHKFRIRVHLYKYVEIVRNKIYIEIESSMDASDFEALKKSTEHHHFHKTIRNTLMCSI